MNIEYDKLNKYINDIYIKYYPEEIQPQILYILKDGKKFRPLLFLSCINSNYYKYEELILCIAVSIEMIHNISLIIDDIPEMDNDNYRRNKESFHFKFGHKYTKYFIYYCIHKLILILHNSFNTYFNFTNINILQTQQYSNNNLNNINTIENTIENDINDLKVIMKNVINNVNKDIINLNFKYIKYITNIISEYINILIEGQYIDMNNNINIDNYLKVKIKLYSNLDIEYIINLILNKLIQLNILCENNKKDIINNIILNIYKTGSLFTLSMVLGIIINSWIFIIHNNFNNINLLITIENDITIWAFIFGYLYQLQDDILDYDNDVLHNKPNICKIINKNNSILLFNFIYNWLLDKIKKINNNIIKINIQPLNINIITHIMLMIYNNVNSLQ